MEILESDKLPKTPDKTKLELVTIAISKWMSVIACIFLAVMVLIVTLDVAGRDIFTLPIRGAFELVGLFLILASTWGLGYCQLKKGHIRIPLFYDMFPRKVRLALDILAYFICLVSAGLLSWQMLRMAVEYLTRDNGGLTSTLAIPFFPFMLALAIGFGWMCVILLLDLYSSFQGVTKK